MELSNEQLYAFQKFKEGQNIFISGAGGSGKSFLIKHFVHHLMTSSSFPKKTFQVASTTGCSSVLLSENIQNTLEYGKMISVKTIHSWSGIRLCKGDDDKIISSVLKNRHVLSIWKKTHILIVDEVSMMSSKILTILEKLARIIRKNTLPFGGIQLVFLGDMYQLAPVPDIDDPETSKFCFESPVWNTIFPIENHIELKTIFRQTDDSFKEILNQIRIGELSETNKTILKNMVGKKFIPQNENSAIPTKILSTRSKVDFVNHSQYSNITEMEHIYTIKINTKCRVFIDSSRPISPEDIEICNHLSQKEIEYEIQTMKNSIPSPEQLKLKKGCPVMCLVNLNMDMGISNGSLGIIMDFHSNDNPIVLFNNGICMEIEPHIWQNTEYPCLCISQYPLGLSFANTIHKLQGASLDMGIMDLGISIFAEGQIYVALSRVRSLDGLYLLAFHPQKIRVNPKVTEFYRKFPTCVFSQPLQPPTTTTTTTFEDDIKRFAFNYSSFK
jgi:ATP-dependent DNA helicase PIF1